MNTRGDGPNDTVDLRPYRKNDNANVEKKNGSLVRTLLGESRLDKRDLEAELRKLCGDYSN